MLVHIQNAQINWLDYVSDDVSGDDDNVLSACKNRKGEDDRDLLHRGPGKGIKHSAILILVCSQQQTGEADSYRGLSQH